MKNICKNIFITISILSFIILIFSNNSYASGYDNFKSFNNAPRKVIIVQPDKLADITIKIRDNDKVTSVKSYIVDSKGNKIRTPFTAKNVSNKKELIYIMPHATMLKGKTTHFYLEVKDGKGNIFNSEYIVSVKNKTVNGKKVQYYAVNDAPRIINWNISGNKVTFEARDLGGVKSVKVKDINNGNKTIQTYSNLPAGSNKASFDLNKCKKASDKYKLKIITTDIYNLEATRTIYFKKKGASTTTSNTSTPVTSNSSNVQNSVSSSTNTSNQNKSCNHSYGRVKERRADFNKCIIQSYYQCSKCGHIKVIGQKWGHRAYATKVVQTPSSANGCTKITEEHCNRCNALISRDATSHHNFVIVNRYTTGMGNFSKTQVTYKCSICGITKYKRTSN